MSRPAVSVAMSVHNGARFLAPAIDSILGQTFAEFELLIVDDGSTDTTAAILADFAVRDRRIRILSQRNAGLVPSLNRLLAEARAPLIARMDADDIALPNRFARQLERLEREPELGVLGTWTTAIDEHGRELAQFGPDQPTSPEAFMRALEDEALLCHPSVMVRTELVRAAGGYRPAYRHCEDYDLWLRLSERAQLASLPERLMRYRHSSSQVSARHLVDQLVGSRIAWLAHEERVAGRPDPTDGLQALPPLDEVDALFGRTGLAAAIRSWVAPRLLYAPAALTGPGFELLIAHARSGRRDATLWRTALRLMRMGAPVRAARLAATLAGAV